MSPPATIEAHVAAIRDGTARISTGITEALRRISLQNQEIGALLHVMDDVAKARAADLQARVDAGDWPGPLTGVPMVLKDNIMLAGAPTTAGSRILAGHEPIYTATAAARLEAAGAIIIGKANLDEFAMGSSNEFGAFGAARNPYDLARVPGGSSGGSAASIAAGFALGALGSDTGGSVRQPAAFCGLVGLKPQYGAVSRFGLIAFASSLDQIGPLARTPRDCALLYNAISGDDPRDATSCAERRPIDLAALGDARHARFGIPTAWLSEGLDRAVAGAFTRSCDEMSALGVEIVPVALPDAALGIATYHVIANAEASANLARYDGVRYGYRAPQAPDLCALYERTRSAGFGAEVKRRILLGTFVLSAGYYEAYYRKASRVRAQLRAAYEEIFRDVDALFLPTTPAPAFPLGEKLADPLQMYLCDLFTVTANLTGFPAVSFPMGLTESGLPLGAQLCGPARGEAQILGWAQRFTKGQPLPLPGEAR